MHLEPGSITTIVISSSTIAQQVLQKQDLAFSSRFIPDGLCAFDHNKYSVVFLPVSPRWRNLRKIVNLNMFSVNKLDANQHLRSRKVNELIEYVKNCSQNGEVVDFGRAAFTTSLNLLSNTIFCKDTADLYRDSAKEFRDLIRDIMVDAGKPNLVDFFPVLKKLDPQGVKRRMTHHYVDLIKVLGELINERLDIMRSGNAIEYTDALNELIKISQVNPDEIDKIHMEHLFVDLFVAGTDTTSRVVEWGMAEVLKNSETMLKLKSGLRENTGEGQDPRGSRHLSITLLEMCCERLHPPLPFLLPRQIDEEAEVNGYTIPKKSQVIINAWAIGRDPILWKNPLSFDPERFLDSEVDVKGQDFKLIPFGAGRRICPGLPLVMRMVPVMLGSLINCFDWELEGGIPLNELDMEEKFGLTIGKLSPLRAIATSDIV